MTAAVSTCDAKHCRLSICGGTGQLVLAEAYEVPAECPLRLECRDAPLARELLRHAHRVTLTGGAKSLAGELTGHGARFLHLAGLVAAGRLTLVQTPEVKPRFGASRLPTREPTEPPLPPPSMEKTWIGLKVVKDETGEAVAGVKFRVRLTDGREVTLTTRADGSCEEHELDPGTCDVLEMIDDEGWEVVRVE